MSNEELRLQPLKAIHFTYTKATTFNSKLYYPSASFLTYRIWKFRQKYLTLKSFEKNILTSFQVYLLYLAWKALQYFLQVSESLLHVLLKTTDRSNKIMPKAHQKSFNRVKIRVSDLLHHPSFPLPWRSIRAFGHLISTRRLFSSRVCSKVFNR